MEWKDGVESVRVDSLDANRLMINEVFVFKLEIFFIGIHLRGSEITRNEHSREGGFFIVETGFEKSGNDRCITLGAGKLNGECLNVLGIFRIVLVKRETFGE